MSAPTTRRHPRSMQEAFPGTTQYACALVRYSRRPLERAAGVALATAIGIGLASWAWVWWGSA